MDWVDKHQQVWAAVEDDEYEPTDWEWSFLETLEEYAKIDRKLSQKQLESLDRLYDKVING